MIAALCVMGVPSRPKTPSCHSKSMGHQNEEEAHEESPEKGYPQLEKASHGA